MAEKLKFTIFISKQGQSLLEVIFAVSIIGLIMSGFVSAFVYFSKAGQVSRGGATATQLAQEKMEDLRAEKKDTPVSFWEDMENFSTATPTPESLDDGKFERSLNVDYSLVDGSQKRAEVEVEVSWVEQGQDKSVRVKSFYSQY